MIGSLVITLVICIVIHSAHSATPNERAAEMLSKMNITDKLQMMRGIPGIYVGNIRANDHLGIPALKLQDGPQVYNIIPLLTGRILIFF